MTLTIFIVFWSVVTAVLFASLAFATGHPMPPVENFRRAQETARSRRFSAGLLRGGVQLGGRFQSRREPSLVVHQARWLRRRKTECRQSVLRSFAEPVPRPHE